MRVLNLREKNIKVLVCSVNAWNSKVGDNTFPLMLSEFPSKNVASLFIREEQPDSVTCDNYFRISEPRIIKSIIMRNTKTGERVKRSDFQGEAAGSAEHARLYSSGKKQRFYYSKLFVREAIWKLGRWHTDELDEFIDEFKPDIVLYEMSRYIHLNRIVRYIIRRTGAAGVGCFWDDTFTYKQERSLGYKALRFFQRKSLIRLAKYTKEFFAITPKTKSEADEFFKINCTVLTKPIMIQFERTVPECAYPLKMLYAGNLAIGREKTMLSVIRELEKVNRDGIKIRLDIYTKTQLADEYVKAYNTEYSELHDTIPQQEVIEIQNKSDILLFVEALDGKEKIARLSFSTKITDYYAAGKCIFAIGNADLAPMELFVRENSAIVATNNKEIAEGVKKLFDANTILAYADKAYSVGREKYSLQNFVDVFYSTLSKAYVSKSI